MTNTRTETDTMGPIEVESDKYWGAQAQRSAREFQDWLGNAAFAADPGAGRCQARGRRSEYGGRERWTR